jgi:methanogenic corrinoid protein MtbC1
MAELTELALALANLDKEKAGKLFETKLKDGVAPLEILGELNAGMSLVGERYTAGEYFISELVYSGHIMKGVVERLEPLLGDTGPAESIGTVVIGTVKGDIHDIGKNIVITLLQGVGFKVVDLGVDVNAEVFVEKLKETGARVLGLSALLNQTIHEMKNVVDSVTAAGIRDQVKIIIGGAPTNEQVRDYAGADFYALDAPAGVKICRQVYSSA